MSKTRQQKKQAKKKYANKSMSFKDKFIEWWQLKSPIPLLIKFVSFIVLFYLLFSTDFYKEYIFTPVVKTHAWVGAKFLALIGQGTSSVGDLIQSNDYWINIGIGCDGIEPTMLFIGSIFIFPTSWKNKFKGMLWGTIFLIILNQIRIVSLFLIGSNFSKSFFDVMHLDVWQVLFIVLTVATWLVWVQNIDEPQLTTK